MNNFSIGVDLGGTNLRIGAFTSEFQCLGQLTMPTRVFAGPEEVSRDICNGIQKLIHDFKAYGGDLKGIGIGTPGPLELPAGRFSEPPNLPGFDGFELKRTIEDMLQLPICIDCDANAAALAECRSGAGLAQEEDSLCMLTLGTGVGSGIVLEGRIWHGMNGMAGEAGHTSLFPEGPLCSCGSRGCLELYASATGIQRMAAEISANGIAPALASALESDAAVATAEIAHLAEKGNPDAREIFQEVGRCLGRGIAGLVNDFNLPLYVVGGGVAHAWDLFAPAMMEALAQFSYVYRLTCPSDLRSAEKNKTRVVPARLGSDAGLMGAAMLPFAL
jgi:glucokinase